MNDQDILRTVVVLLGGRAAGATVCPSEVARAAVAASRDQGASEDWRRAMPMVHAAIDRLLAEKMLRLSWKGRALATRDGPYRIGRGAQYPQPE